jgi:protein SCO1
VKRITCLLLAFSLFIAAGCQKAPEPAKEKTFDIKGTVLAVDLKKPAVKLDHQDIPGFMQAMVMEFDAASPKVIEGLKAGDKVSGKLKVEAGNSVITRLDKLP